VKTVIIGASPNAERYAYQAAALLKRYGHEFVPVSIKKGEVFGQPIQDIRAFPVIETPHTITLYIRPELQVPYYDYLIGLKPTRIIFNPGTENRELETLVEKSGIEAVEACTLVMLRTGQF
jgi:uncharacterized protein